MNINDRQEKVFAIDLIFLSAMSYVKRVGWFQSPSTTLRKILFDSLKFKNHLIIEMKNY